MKSTLFCAGIVACALSGCGTQSAGPGLTVLNQLASGVVAGGDAAAIAASDPRQTLTRAEVDAAGQPVLLVVIPSRNAAASMTVVGNNAGRQTWASAAGETLTLQDGILIASKALGDDLMGHSVPGGSSAIRSGAATQRVYEFLNGEDRISSLDLVCQATNAGSEDLVILERIFATRKMVETCTGNGLSIENTYWFGSDGQIRKSIQWVSFGVGVVEIAHL